MSRQSNKEVGVALAFHGITGITDLKCGELFGLIKDWATSIGRAPTVGEVGRNISESKLKPFESVLAGIKRSGFRNVRSFSIIHEDNTIEVPHWGRVFNCTFGNDFVMVSEKSKCKLTESSLLPIALNIIDLIRPQYGIAYYREWMLSPYYYALGMPQGLGRDIGPDSPEVQSEIENISRWGDVLFESKVYSDGLIRDVYPWNFLSTPALNRTIDGIPLMKWIESDKSRGVLKPLSQGVILWEVAQANISNVRKVLWNADIIYKWRKNL